MAIVTVLIWLACAATLYYFLELEMDSHRPFITNIFGEALSPHQNYLSPSDVFESIKIYLAGFLIVSFIGGFAFYYDLYKTFRFFDIHFFLLSGLVALGLSAVLVLIRKYRDERWLKAHTDDISEPNLYADELAELPYPLDYGNQIGKMPARQHVRTTKKVINKKLGKNVIFAIEIIASVLGIISFYLDYLR